MILDKGYDTERSLEMLMFFLFYALGKLLLDLHYNEKTGLSKENVIIYGN